MTSTTNEIDVKQAAQSLLPAIATRDYLRKCNALGLCPHCLEKKIERFDRLICVNKECPEGSNNA